MKIYQGQISGNTFTCQGNIVDIFVKDKIDEDEIRHKGQLVCNYLIEEGFIVDQRIDLRVSIN